jgi:short-subunit dehydrogenase
MKTILITGASSGIGKATAELFFARGWNVVATMRTPKRTREDGRWLVTRLGVTDPASIGSAAPLGIKVKLIEPGAIKTDFYDRSSDSCTSGRTASTTRWSTPACAA